VLHDKRIQHGWKYGDHYMPHDIKHRELTTGRSRLQALNILGIDAVVVPESSVLDGINVVRRMLGRTWIDANRCERGIEALRQYRRKYDDKLKDWKTATSSISTPPRIRSARSTSWRAQRCHLGSQQWRSKASIIGMAALSRTPHYNGSSTAYLISIL
jgi:hypothetical protein